MTVSHGLFVRRAAVLGAGVMGAQIAAHLVNAGVEAVLFDLPAGEGDGSATARKALRPCAACSPAPWVLPRWLMASKWRTMTSTWTGLGNATW